MSSEKHHHEGHGGERDYADRDIHLGAIIKSGLVIAVFVAATFWGAREMIRWVEKTLPAGETAASPFAEQRVLPPEPRLQVDEKRTLEEQRAHDRKMIETYDWVDARSGIVRIPVERAMDLALERGFPVSEGGQGK